MQDGFVLCRLSLKAKFPETHMAGSFFSEETKTWDKLFGKKSEGKNQWLIDKLDNMAPYDVIIYRNLQNISFCFCFV